MRKRFNQEKIYTIVHCAWREGGYIINRYIEQISAIDMIDRVNDDDSVEVELHPSSAQ